MLVAKLAARGRRADYIDAEAFTRLFRQRRKNHSEICRGLQLIVAGVARTFAHDHADQRDDVESATLLYVIKLIGRFDAGVGANAFSYYTRVTFNEMRRQIRAVRRGDDRLARFTDLGIQPMRDCPRRPFRSYREAQGGN